MVAIFPRLVPQNFIRHCFVAELRKERRFRSTAFNPSVQRVTVLQLLLSGPCSKDCEETEFGDFKQRFIEWFDLTEQNIAPKFYKRSVFVSYF